MDCSNGTCCLESLVMRIGDLEKNFTTTFMRSAVADLLFK